LSHGTVRIACFNMRVRLSRFHFFRGFTLVELMVVVAIIAVLAAVILPVLAGAKKSSWKIACLANSRQIGMASQMYADDTSPIGYLSGQYDCSNAMCCIKVIQESRDLNWAYKAYVPNLKTFICPSTKNYVDVTNITTQPNPSLPSANPLYSDLFNSAKNTLANGTFTRGLSYEVFGGWKWENPGGNAYGESQYQRKTKQSILSYRHHFNPMAPMYNFDGVIISPSDTWILEDNLGAHNDVTPGIPGDWPNKVDCHFGEGANVSFCDGRATWVPKLMYDRLYQMSEDTDRPQITGP